ncbi:uncharacterized protein METZ01_LOCUS413092, partial [marine metagenome]
DGFRSYMAFFVDRGDHAKLQFAREFGSTTQLSNATAIAIHPVNEDMYISGLWENSKATCTGNDSWWFTPTKPDPNFPNMGVDHSVFTRPSGEATKGGVFCDSHEKVTNSSGGHVPNQDTYVLHVDKYGNFKNIEVFDVHLEKELKPQIAINSDGSEIAIANTGMPKSLERLGGTPTPGANGWVMTLNTDDLSQNWLSINKRFWAGPENVEKQYSWTDDVAYGPDDKVHAAGRHVWSTLYGETETGTLASQNKYGQNNPDGWTVRYTLDGKIDNGAP